MPVLISPRDTPCGGAKLSDTASGLLRLRAPVISNAAATLRDHEVHLWTLAAGNEETSEYTPLLSAAEMERAQRFRFPALFRRFVADHGRLRLLVASYLDVEPQSLQFVTNEQGKPRLSGPDCRLRFNMSHTRGLTLISVCLDAEMGVDIEAFRAVEDRDRIAAFHFSPIESAALLALPPHERDAAFLRCWTRKEAYIKARGEGLSLPLNKFAVTLAANDRAALLQCDWDEQELHRWRLEHLQPRPGYIGALAIEKGKWSLLYFTWPAGDGGNRHP